MSRDGENDAQVSMGLKAVPKLLAFPFSVLLTER